LIYKEGYEKVISVKRGIHMRKIFSYNTIDTIKFFSVVFGLVGILLVLFYFSMNFIESQYNPNPYMVVESPAGEYTARVNKSNKKEGVTITVSIYDKMSRIYRRNFYVQANCDKMEISWKQIDALIINKVTLNVKSKAVKFTKADDHYCPITSVIN
jgi:hypothetical protein